MKLTYPLIAATALACASPLAAGNQAQRSQSESPSQQSADVVKQAQEKLSAAGHDAGPADGILGSQTQAAVKEFQQSKGIQTSGQLDSQTLAELRIDASRSSASSGASVGASPEQRNTGTGGSDSPGTSPERTAEPKSQY
jgi:peptidoglycan hydrolase-like protein with peptidoglycan-binding domain